MSKNSIIKGTFILTATGFVTRLIGFFFRMFLSHTFGEEQVGLYQLIFPIYGLCFSLCTAGIETALSRCVAQKLARGENREADTLLYQALGISVSLSVLLGIMLRRYATFLSIYILGDLRCEALITALSYVLPFSSIHCSFCGYYFGQRQTKIPAISQFVEQVTRVGAVYLLYLLFLNKGMEISIFIAVLGLVAGECFSAIFCVRCFCSSHRTHFTLPALYASRKLAKELIVLAIPLTSSRVLMNILQSVETISIPLCLQRYGYTNSEALSTYGVLTGMALPCILFPTALTNSVSTMLLPTVSEFEAQGNLMRLKKLIQKVLLFGFGMGAFFAAIFLCFGSLIGGVLFGSTLAGDFMRTLAWICPFLYINSTLISILNGLGKATRSFFINAGGLTIRILGVWVGIRMWGMQGYLWGLLASQLLVSLCCILHLKQYWRVVA